MELASLFVALVLAVFSLPCLLLLLLLLLLNEAAVRLDGLALGAPGTAARYTWPTRSAFLGYRIGRAPGALDCGEPPLPPECCDRIAIALYRSGGAAAEEVDCVFCLSRIEEGEEVRELRCRHVFHRVCLDGWLVRPRATCPLCRDRLLPSEPARACAEELDDGEDAHAHAHDDHHLSSADMAVAAYSHGGVVWHI